MQRFADDLKTWLRRQGFQTVAVDYEWVVEKRVKDDLALIRIATKTGRQGFAVHDSVTW